MSKSRTGVVMQRLARAADIVLNRTGEKKNGFVILVFPFNAERGARTNYVSNVDRGDIVVALKEIVARFEGQPKIAGRA